MLTTVPRLGVRNRLSHAMADPARSRIRMAVLQGSAYAAILTHESASARPNESIYRACLRTCGVIVSEPDGRQNRYRIIDPILLTR